MVSRASKTLTVTKAKMLEMASITSTTKALEIVSMTTTANHKW